MHLVDNKDLITYERSLCLYAFWTQKLIDYDTLAMILMKGIPRHSKLVLLPFGALIT